MRVAVVSMYTPDHRDDPAVRRTQRVAEGLADAGHAVEWLCAQWWDGESPTFERADVRYRRVTRTPGVGTFRSKLPFVLRRVDPAVVHAVADPPAQVTSAVTASRFLRVPVVADWWGTFGDSPDRTYRKAARKPHRVLTPSETVRTAVRELGAEGDRVQVVPESVDFGLVESAAVDDTADVVYCRRRLDEHANVESFLLALAELRDRDFQAVVIGDGPARRDAQRTARDLRIDDRVAFLGALPPEEFVPIMKGAHAFAQTATREPFATGLLWALACGCVGIVEYQAGSSAHELVETYERGRRVTDPEELADAIRESRSMPDLAVAEAFADYDHRPVLDRYVTEYERAIDAYGLF